MENTARFKNTSQVEGDRFIPVRSAMDFEQSHFELLRDRENACPNSTPVMTPSKSAARSAVGTPSAKILAFKHKAPAPKEGYQNANRVLYIQQKKPVQKIRTIRSAPERILDAPDMVDDYYLNLLDWSSTNVLAIALSRTVFLWNATTSQIHKLVELEGEDLVTSVTWLCDGSYLAVGTNSADVNIYDAQALKHLRCMKGHLGRVSSLAWNNEHFILSSGSRDSRIFHHDVRVANHLTATLENHCQEICGLKWSADGSQLASGGNDNLCNIWDVQTTTPRFTFDEHMAAVKALAWSPFQTNLLATGGGTADRHIRLWDTTSGICLNSIDTCSQVCALQWSLHHKELISAHGFAENQLVVWKYPAMVRIAELKRHTRRVLHMAQSPDGTTIVSAGADEQLCFWRVSDGPQKRTNTGSSSMMLKKASAFDVSNAARVSLR